MSRTFSGFWKFFWIWIIVHTWKKKKIINFSDTAVIRTSIYSVPKREGEKNHWPIMWNLNSVITHNDNNNNNRIKRLWRPHEKAEETRLDTTIKDLPNEHYVIHRLKKRCVYVHIVPNFKHPNKIFMISYVGVVG